MNEVRCVTNIMREREKRPVGDSVMDVCNTGMCCTVLLPAAHSLFFLNNNSITRSRCMWMHLCEKNGINL